MDMWQVEETYWDAVLVTDPQWESSVSLLFIDMDMWQAKETYWDAVLFTDAQ